MFMLINVSISRITCDLSLPVGVPLVLDDQVLLVDGLQQGRGQRLEVGDGLGRGWQAAALLLQQHLLD